SKEAHDACIRSARRQLTRKPPLALPGIIFREQMCRAVVPANAKPFTQFQAHARVTHQVADVSCLHAMLRHDPELIADAPIAHWSTARLARLATQSFEKRISRRSETDSKQKFDRQIEKVFLQQMNNPMFHLLVLTSAFLQTVRLSSRVSASF